MTRGSNIPPDVEASCNELLSKKKISLKKLVSLEVKSEKWETKVVALSPYRLYLLPAKAPCRVEVSLSFLDIQSITSKKGQQLHIDHKDGRRLSMALVDAKESFDNIICHILVSLKNLHPHLNVQEKLVRLDLPADRLGSMRTALTQASQKEAGACGGFTNAYTCMCDYHGLPYREDIAWDVDTIYMSQDSRELNLADFDHLDSRDLIPVIGALQHNMWFKKFNASNVKLSSEAQSELLRVIETNATIEELSLENSGIKGEFLGRLASALTSNSNCPLSGIDLSNNTIEDRGLYNLCGPISQLPKGLTYLKLARTGLTAKGANKLAEALVANPYMSSSLQSLDLSENSFKGEDITQVYSFLGKTNSITSLNLSGTECILDMVFGALLHGCCQFLQHLDLSRNSFSKRGKDSPVPPALRQFFASSCALQKVSLSGCKLPPEAVKNLLLAIASNPTLAGVEVDLSCCELRTPGAHIIESCIMGIHNITALDLSDNGFDNDMIGMLNHLKRNQAIKRLAIGKNFFGIKPKYLVSTLESVVNLIQEEECAVESLSLADSKLKADTVEVINALGSNTTLKELDISGNQMGDLGARMLAKALQINSKLHTVYWDRNAVTAQGFQDVAFALQKNYTLKKMPTPICDAAASLRTQPDRTEAALQQIESLLQRNHSPQKFGSDQGYRLQQGILISSTQQLVDRLVVNVQDTISSLQKAPLDDHAQEDISKAQSLVHDADNSKQLLPGLQVVALKSEDQGNLVETRLNKMAQELNEVIHQQLTDTLQSMLHTTEEQCPTVMNEGKLKSQIESACSEKKVLPKDFTKTLLVDQVGADFMNKISEVNLSMAAVMSSELIDAVLDSLSACHKQLTNHLNSQLSKQRENEETDSISRNSLKVLQESPTPDKRKSIHNRKLRPKSVIDREEVQKALRMTEIAQQERTRAPSSGRTTPESGLMSTGSTDGDSVSMTTSTDSLLSSSSQEDLLESKRESLMHKYSGVDMPLAKKDLSIDEGLGSGEAGDTDKKPVAAVRTKKERRAAAAKSSLPALEAETGPKLEHLGKSRPRRAKTRAATRPTVRTEHIIEETEDVSAGLDSFFEKAPVTKKVTSPTSSGLGPKGSVDKSQKDDKAKKTEKKALIPDLKKGLTGLFKKSPNSKSEGTKDGTAESPSLSTAKELPALSKPKEADVKAAEDSVPDISTPEESKEKEQKELEEQPEIVMRRPAGLPKMGMPGMGMGGAFLAEMKAKRSSMNPAAFQKQTEKSEAEKKEEMPLFSKSSLRPTSVMQQPKLDQQKRLSPLSSANIAHAVDTEEKKESSSSTPKQALKPPPTRPRPPPIAPKPGPPPKPTNNSKPIPAVRTSFGSGGRISDTEEKPGDRSSSGSEAESKAPTEPKRNSVKDRIANLDKNSNEQTPSPLARTKTSSLPKTIVPLDKDEGPQRSQSLRLLDEPKSAVTTESSSGSQDSIDKPADGPKLQLPSASPRASREDSADDSGGEGSEVYI